MYAPRDFIDTRDAAEALRDPETPVEWRRFIAELFAGFGIDAADPDAIEVTMIPECEWVGYVRELITDCGYLTNDLPDWIAVDWQETANNVAWDYVMHGAEINGETRYYYFRAV